MNAQDSESEPWDDLTQLWHKHNKRLLWFVVKLGVPRAGADDIVVDAFLVLERVLGNATRLDQPEQFLYKVARNLCEWGYSERIRHLSELVGEIEDLDADYADPSVDTAMRTDVIRAVRRLRPRCREVVLLRYYLNFSVKETAQILGISEGAVKSYAAEARAMLADLLNAYAPGKGDR